MTDFTPGDAYRIDIVGADSSIIVDSWSSQIRGDVVSVDGLVLVDTGEGKLYGPLIGNIENASAETIIDVDNKLALLDVKGDIIGGDDNILVDSQLSLIYADVKGNIIGAGGDLLLDSENYLIYASRIEGDLYGDFYGDLAEGNTLEGSFSGNFSGTVHGTVEADVVGSVYGNLVGDSHGVHVGTVVGDVEGFLYREANVPLTAIINDEPVWLGGVVHPDQKDGTPIIDVAAQTAKIFGDIIHPDGTTVVEINTLEEIDHKATFKGKLQGEVCNSLNQIMLTGENKTNLLATNNWIQIGEYGYEELTVTGKNIVFNLQTKQHEAMIHINAHKGYLDAPQPVAGNDGLAVFGANGYDGINTKLGGAFGIYVDSTKPHNQDNPYIPSKFGISLSDGNKIPSFTDENRLVFGSDGVLEVPIFKAQGTTFAQRDGMVAEPGMIIFNVNSFKFQGFTGTEWVDLH